MSRWAPKTWALASIAFIGLALASSAAGAPWAPPVTVGANATYAPSIGITASGTDLLSARFAAANPSRFPVGKLRLFTGLHGSGFKSVTTFGGQVQTYRTYGRSRAIVVLRRVLARDRNYIETVRLSYAFGSATGHFGAAHTLWTGKLYDDPVIAATGSGAIAVAWTEIRGDGKRLWIAVRPRGGHFGPARVLVGSGSSINPSVAWGAGGNLLVAFARNRRLHNRAVRDVAVRVQRGGHPFGPVRAIGPSQGLTDPVAGFAPTGQMYVAWGTQDTGEEANEPWRVYAASASSPAHHFGTAQVLEPGGANARPAGRVALAVGRDGTATVGWSAALGGSGTINYPARVASADANGRFSAAQQLSPNASMEDLALGPDGTLMAVVSTLPHGDNQEGEQVLASFRAPGAAQFGTPEAVSPVERARDARAAFDYRTGRPTIVWVGQPGAGPSTPSDTLHPTALRAATRG